jgi:glycine cleavage system regulatory protein
MNIHLVITVIADDRPGIVKALSDAIKNSGGNWMESRMSRLGGKFAGILRIDVSATRRASLVETLESLRESGIRVVVETAEKLDESGSESVSITLMGNDRPGIVDEVSQILAGRGANVEELSTSVASAPMSAQELFHAIMVTRLPPGMNRDELQRALEGLSDDLTVEINKAD